MSASKFSERKATRILERIAAGESLAKITTKTETYKPPIARSTWYAWLKANPELVKRFEVALSERADKYFEEIIDLADAPPRIVVEEVKRGKATVIVERVDTGYEQQRRTQIDARKFTVARLAPKKYGDRMTTDVNARVEHVGLASILSNLGRDRDDPPVA